MKEFLKAILEKAEELDRTEDGLAQYMVTQEMLEIYKKHFEYHIALRDSLITMLGLGVCANRRLHHEEGCKWCETRTKLFEKVQKDKDERLG
jgi:hypothetical protein